MFDAFSQNTADVGISLDEIAGEVMTGLQAHVDRLQESFDCEEFLAGRNIAYLKRKQSEEYLDYLNRPKRTSKLLRKVIRKLAEHLYSPGPTRQLKAPASVQSWLDQVYEANHINAVMQVADRKANLNAACAIQVVCTGQPDKPVALRVWGAHEFVPFFAPYDPTTPWAVVTIHREQKHERKGVSERLRFEAWSRDEYRQYVTGWQEKPPTYSALFGRQSSFMPQMYSTQDGTDQVNPYGCLPFAFVHDELPVTQFWEGGIGTPLRECNEELDREISQIAQHVKDCIDPDRFLRNVSPAWRREKRPGAWQRLEPDVKALQPESGIQPEAFFAQPTVNTEAGWADVRQYADSLLEEMDVPLTAVRDGNPVEMSGVALQTKLRPLLERVRQRQLPFARYEQDLARVILTAAGNYYKIGPLLDASDAELTLVWPEPTFGDPSPERDGADDWELSHGIKSLVDVVAERRGVTREKALEIIEQVHDDNEALEEFFPAGVPEAPSAEPQPEPGEEPEAGQQQQPGGAGAGEQASDTETD